MSSPRPNSGTFYTFLRELRTTGAPVVHIQGAGLLKECLSLIEDEATRDSRVMGLLREWHREALLDLAGPALPFDSEAATWGAKILFRSAWFYLDRDSESDDVASLLAEPMPVANSPASFFSADLALQSIPSIFHFARALAPGDALLGCLQKLASDMPLSGVGIDPKSDTSLPQLSLLQVHPGLWQLFIDRIVECNARWWLRVPSVRDSMQKIAGAFQQDLIPAFDLSQFNSTIIS